MNNRNHELLIELRERYPKGTRIQLIQMDDPYTKLVQGDKGTVNFVDDIGTIHVIWDSGATLGIVYGVDSCCIIKE